MMKNVFKILLVAVAVMLVSVASFAQGYRPMSGYGYQMERLVTDSLFFVPNADTVLSGPVQRPGALVFRTKDGDRTLYAYDGIHWINVSAEVGTGINAISFASDSLVITLNNGDSVITQMPVYSPTSSDGTIEYSGDGKVFGGPLDISAVGGGGGGPSDGFNRDSAIYDVSGTLDSGIVVEGGEGTQFINNIKVKARPSLPIWNAGSIYGTPVYVTAPEEGQALVFDGNTFTNMPFQGSDTATAVIFPVTKSIQDNLITLGVDTSSSGLATNQAVRDTLDGKLVVDTTGATDVLHDINPGYGANVSGGAGTVINQDVTVSVDTTSTHALVSKDRLANAISNLGFGDMLKSVYDPTGVEGDAFDYRNLHHTPGFDSSEFVPPTTDNKILVSGPGKIFHNLHFYLNPDSIYGAYPLDDSISLGSNANLYTQDGTITDAARWGNLNGNQLYFIDSTLDDPNSNYLLKLTKAGLDIHHGTLKVANTPKGTAGTDSLLVKHSGTVEAVSPKYYAKQSALEDTAASIRADFPSGNDGSVTSVALSAPTGFSVGGSPVTSSGTLALTFASGYKLPTIAKQDSWDDKADLSDIENSTITVSAGGIATGGGNFTLNQASNKTITVSVPATDLGITGTTGARTITSSTGDDVPIPLATTAASGLLSPSDKVKLNNLPASSTLQEVTHNGNLTDSSLRVKKGSDSVIIYNNGNVLMTGHLTAIGGGSTGSDIRLKDTLSMEPIHVIDQLHTVMFRYKHELGLGDKLHIGYIAQEVEKYMPSSVGSTDSGIKTVDYEQVHTAAINDLIQIVKQQQKQIDALTARVENLEGKKHNPKSGYVPGLGSYRVIDTMTAFKLAHMDKEHRNKISVIQNEKGKLVFVYWNEKRDQ